MKIFFIIISLLFTGLSFGQDTNSLTAAQILDASIQFCGGEKRIEQIQTSNLTYTVVQDASNVVLVEKTKYGQKYVQSILSKTTAPQTIFFDGKTISQVSHDSVHRTHVDQKEEIRLKTYLPLQYGYKKLRYELTRLPDIKFQHFDCYVINATAPNGYSTMNFFDKTNYRLLMVVYPNGNKSMMIDYAFKDSILFNSYIINTFPETDEQQEWTLESVELNEPINDLWFKCPSNTTLPAYIKNGKFEATNGQPTIFVRNEYFQEYQDEKGTKLARRYLKWGLDDTFALIDEKALQNKDTSPETEILVRIISWDEDEYVCQWIAGKYSDTQDYKIIQ